MLLSFTATSLERKEQPAWDIPLWTRSGYFDKRPFRSATQTPSVRESCEIKEEAATRLCRWRSSMKVFELVFTLLLLLPVPTLVPAQTAVPLETMGKPNGRSWQHLSPFEKAFW